MRLTLNAIVLFQKITIKRYEPRGMLTSFLRCNFSTKTFLKKIYKTNLTYICIQNFIKSNMNKFFARNKCRNKNKALKIKKKLSHLINIKKAIFPSKKIKKPFHQLNNTDCI